MSGIRCKVWEIFGRFLGESRRPTWKNRSMDLIGRKSLGDGTICVQIFIIYLIYISVVYH
jgi:hypothetical protein